MMNRKIKVTLISSTLIIILTVVLYHIITNTTDTSTTDNNKIAFSLYFTKDMTSGINKGKIISYQDSTIKNKISTTGIDNGIIFYDENTLHSSDTETMFAYDENNLQTYKKKRKFESMSISSFKFGSDIVHINNSGYGDDNSYNTTLYNATKNNQLIIKDIISNVGHSNNTLFLMSDRDENNRMTIYTVTSKNDQLTPAKKLYFQGTNNGESHIIGDLIYYNESLLFVEDDGIGKVNFVMINLPDNKITKKKLLSYKTSDEISELTPYSNTNSVFLFKENCYFLDATGILHQVDLKTLTLTKQTLANDTTNRYIDIKKDSLYLFEENDTNNLLKEYTLKSDGTLHLKSTTNVMFPLTISGMYLSNFKLKK